MSIKKTQRFIENYNNAIVPMMENLTTEFDIILTDSENLIDAINETTTL